ncbi:MAG: tetratricopeptide repeat protein [Kouleothrix sp.]
MYERALAITEQALGPAHPDTATSLNNLAPLLQAQGDFDAARPYLERALAIREQALGPAHPDTATSLNNLAMLLYAQGDFNAARPLYERALAIHEQALGPAHPITATSLNNLAAAASPGLTPPPLDALAIPSRRGRPSTPQPNNLAPCMPRAISTPPAPTSNARSPSTSRRAAPPIRYRHQPQ